MYTRAETEIERRLKNSIKFHALLYNGEIPALSIYIEYTPRKNEIYCGGCNTIETMSPVPDPQSKRLSNVDPLTFGTIDDLIRTIGSDQMPLNVLNYLKKIAKSTGEEVLLPN